MERKGQRGVVTGWGGWDWVEWGWGGNEGKVGGVVSGHARVGWGLLDCGVVW